ncbi:MAG TPA: site-2 protease family protein [Candidatus Moranbacteria bacterium]|nr:site-2 protease family protein [Candidatus Moranbacteria bacterium]HRY28177.1 site-2 protease family protein [Candidatus Moranbacteria bacterium]HSA08682.1 site-2 protease family protein [Candidatus Moranbacteria bacterium]
MDLNSIILIGFYIAILVYTIIIHEVAHGFVALWLGDPTAKYSGRLNFNPISHIDIWGSIIVPIAMILTTGFAFGWAKPVPYNPYNLKNQKWGPLLVALGGPGSNILIAILAAVIAKIIPISGAVKSAIIIGVAGNSWQQVSEAVSSSLGSIFFALLMIVIFWNVLLAFFNLIPFPPLDGSKVLFTFLPISTEKMIAMEQYGFIFLLLFIMIFSTPLGIFLNFMLNIFFRLAL